MFSQLSLSDFSHPLVRLGLLVGAVILLGSLEMLRPLRKNTESKAGRWLRNFTLAGLSGLVLRLTVLPLLLLVAQDVEERGWGLFSFLSSAAGWSASALLVASFFVQDLILYYWHRANHQWSVLWRFHQVHHVDLDMDVSTASRFHAGELVLSALFLCVPVFVLGLTPAQLLLHQIVLITAAQFHHSNLRLPEWLERVLQPVIITPRLHEVHHSIVQRETDSNWGTVFSFWDRLHGSFRHAFAPGMPVLIGVASHRDPAEVSFASLLFLPFQKPRPWRLPDGKVPERGAEGALLL